MRSALTESIQKLKEQEQFEGAPSTSSFAGPATPGSSSKHGFQVLQMSEFAAEFRQKCKAIDGFDNLAEIPQDHGCTVFSKYAEEQQMDMRQEEGRQHGSFNCLSMLNGESIDTPTARGETTHGGMWGSVKGGNAYQRYFGQTGQGMRGSVYVHTDSPELDQLARTESGSKQRGSYNSLLMLEAEELSTKLELHPASPDVAEVYPHFHMLQQHPLAMQQ